MKNYKGVIIKGNRMLIFTLLGCVAIMIFLTVRLYMKQQKRVMKGQARYDILSEFSDTVLFEYDCLDKTLVFTPNITTLFGLKEIGQIRPFDKKLYRPPPGDKLLITGHFLLMALFRDL